MLFDVISFYITRYISFTTAIQCVLCTLYCASEYLLIYYGKCNCIQNFESVKQLSNMLYIPHSRIFYDPFQNSVNWIAFWYLSMELSWQSDGIHRILIICIFIYFFFSHFSSSFAIVVFYLMCDQFSPLRYIQCIHWIINMFKVMNFSINLWKCIMYMWMNGDKFSYQSDLKL